MVSGRPVDRDQESPDASGGRTVLGFPLVDRLVLVGGLPALGLLLGFLLPPFARWATGLSIGLPMRPAFKLLGAVDKPWEVAACLAVGLVLGLGVALVTMTESMKVTLTDTELRLDKDDRTRTVARADVDAVFLDGKKLVVLDHESRQLVRDTHQAPGAALARAFRAHGYPWQDADPYADLYRRWVRDTPDLPPAVNAVLAAREVALRKKAGREVRDLGDAIEKLGFAAREEGARQCWRPLVRS
jgi:hypothetical protein